MFMYNLKTRKPESLNGFDNVLIKDRCGYYYVCCPYIKNNKWVFEEACGERYAYWDEDEVVAWISIKELDSLVKVID